MNADRFAEAFGPAALITGASDGIGRAMAREAARRGLSPILVARRRDRLEALAEELARDHGARPVVHPADLSRREEVAALLAATEGRDIGLVAACAGFGTSGPLAAARLDDELGMIEVNVAALLHLTQAFAGRLSARGRGGIVLMSSLVAFQGVPRAANYAATKAYVQTLAEGLRRELAPAGVAVLSVAPGPVHSGFAARADMRMGLAATPETVARGAFAALGRRGTSRPGLIAQGLELSLAPLPRTMRTRILALVMGGMTKHQRAAGT